MGFDFHLKAIELRAYLKLHIRKLFVSFQVECVCVCVIQAIVFSLALALSVIFSPVYCK